jgi:hypothetical protein
MAENTAPIDLAAALSEARTALEAAEAKLIFRSKRQGALTDGTSDHALAKLRVLRATLRSPSAARPRLEPLSMSPRQLSQATC